ncbi:hypothetical protein [Ciceribacter azotifigens]|uniref:hypothetical protein n=1 Tax=Ciceribacter azotifigens TaxID=2069303 RepID=UPI003A8BB181
MSNDRLPGAVIPTAAMLACLVALSGCNGSQPQPYSPNYRYLSTTGATPAKGKVVRKGYDTTTSQVLVPDACITPDTADQPVYLPSGCANNLNLQFMAADQRQLLQGRDMGPAMAAPVARAAKGYIDGTGDQVIPPGTATNETGIAQ